MCAWAHTHRYIYIHPHNDTDKSCSNAAQEYIPFKAGRCLFLAICKKAKWFSKPSSLWTKHWVLSWVSLATRRTKVFFQLQNNQIWPTLPLKIQVTSENWLRNHDLIGMPQWNYKSKDFGITLQPRYIQTGNQIPTQTAVKSPWVLLNVQDTTLSLFLRHTSQWKLRTQ